MLDVLFCMIIFVFGLNLSNRFKEFDKYDKTLLKRLFLYHMIFGVAYYFYVGGQGGDAEMYWGFPKKFLFSDIWLYFRGDGATKFVATLNYFPAHILDLSFFSGFMLYAFIGYIGWIYFYLILKENVPDLTNVKRYKILGFSLLPWVLFLPNLHFWSAGIGKDSILFMCSALFLYGCKNIKKRILPMVISIGLAAFIRPHILLFLISAIGGATLIDKKVKTPTKVFLFIVFGAAFIIMIPYVMEFANLDSLDIDSVDKFAASKALSLSSEETGSAVDTSDYPIILKVFTFLYRPLFFDATGLLGIMASLENVFLLFFTFKVFQSKPYAAFKKGNLVIKSALIFFVIGSIAFSMILGNLGIMLRQKTPFILSLIIFGFWALSIKRAFRNNI